MKVISVKASGRYDVVIGSNLLSKTGEYIKNIHDCGKAAIISDSNVWPIYGSTVASSLTNAGFTPTKFVFPAGENSKNIETYLQILNFLAENAISRSDVIVALGGGVVGDITGFAAATFLRGVPFVQIPTSLLAMVDSSVGGKTAIDLPAGKNLVGAFKQPQLVLCDVNALHSLPDNQFRDGCAEVIKYGMLYDVELLNTLSENGTGFEKESVIAKCIALKRDVVQEDEFDTGMRQMLNLGHTIGHGIEAGSHYEISHGQAVAAGMAIVARAAVAKGYCKVSVSEALEACLTRFGLPTKTNFNADQLFQSALSDKKRSGGNVNLIIPRDIGCCDIVPTPVSDLKSFIEVGL